MNIEEILKQEDEHFFKAYEENESKPKKKTAVNKKVSIENIEDTEELRDVVLDILTKPVQTESYMESIDKKNKFPRQQLTNDINSILSKYKFKVERMAEKEAVGIFVKNLESILKM